MGADNWGKCPQCVIREEKRVKKLLRKVEQAYGRVTPEEYIVMVEEAKRPAKIDETLREDYELGTDASGEFSVDYSCCCTKCGFTHQFNLCVQLEVKGEKDE